MAHKHKIPDTPENARLRRQLEEARVINEFQKKACEILDIPLKDRASSEGA
ncbi:MAG: hypothetical protein V3W02_00265 [Gammaproteobacteria bacterium]